MTFTVYGEPKGKARPRFGKGYARKEDNTAVYENLVRLEYEKQCRNERFEAGVPVKIEIAAYFKIPQSASKKKQEEMRRNHIFPTTRPDLDNVCKAILDGGNGVAYYDDAQIVTMHCYKLYSDIPRVVVTIEEEFV